MKVLRFLRRRRRQHPDWRTRQRICLVAIVYLTQDGDEYTIDELARLTGQSVGSMYEVMGWMERMGLAFGYYPEPPIPGRLLGRLYLLTPKAYKWATDALMHEKQLPPEAR